MAFGHFPFLFRRCSCVLRCSGSLQCAFLSFPAVKTDPFGFPSRLARSLLSFDGYVFFHQILQKP